MAAKTKPFWVGLFVICGVAIALLALIWLGASDWFAESLTYATYFDSSVRGLNIGAPVKFRGINVGKVVDISIAPDGNLVEILMELEPGLRVGDNMRAKLILTGVTGVKYIECDIMGAEDLDFYPQLSFKPVYPVIPSAPSSFEEMEQSLQEVLARLNAIDTRGISYRTKEFLDAATKTASAADSLLTDSSFTAWARNLDCTVRKADSMLMSLDLKYYDVEIEQTLRELRQGAGQFNRFFTKLEQEAVSLNIAADLDTVARSLNRLIAAGDDRMRVLHYQTAAVLNNVNTTIETLNKAIEQLNALMVSMEAYPSNILYSAPPPKEK